LKIEGDIGVSDFAKSANDQFANGRSKESFEFRRRHFNAGQRIMVSDAKSPESESSEYLFGLLDSGELLHGDLVAVWDPRGKTGERRLIPGRKTEFLREGADLELGQARLRERRSDPEFLRRTGAGSMVGAVIGNLPVRDESQPQILSHGEKLLEEFALAEIATIGGVGSVSLSSDFTGLDQYVPCADESRELFRLFQLGPRKRFAHGRHGDGPISEDVPGDLEEKRAVDAAREGDGDALHFAESGAERLELGVRHGGEDKES